MERDVKNFCKLMNENFNIKQSVKKIRKKYPKGEMSVKDTYDFITNGIIPLAKENHYNFDFDDYIDYQLKEESGSLEKEELFDINGGRITMKSLGVASIASIVSEGTDLF
ncbi:MAG: hypothetical protein LBT82_00745 [Oscillospiraceae bacterium]|jgi:hypothetical protein|nr:hypothetical protein [Oscillospiraceae bacterium]